MRILDCFPYFNEKELLELRINLLYDEVDKFIICDADKTHKGDPKPFTCKNTLQELGLLSDKIQVIEVNMPSYLENPNAWVRERMQRNAVEKYIESDDVCIISDCDEIINPKFVKYYANTAQQYPQNILRIPLAFLMCRGDLRSYDEFGNSVPWSAPYFCMKSHLQKYTLSDIRESYALSTNYVEYSDIFITENGIIEDAGWHFSWMGDENRIKIKNDSFLHWNEVSVQENYIPKENSPDCLGRQNHILKKYSINLLPEKIFELNNVTQFLFPQHNDSKISVVQIGTNHAHDNLSDYLLSNYDNLTIGVFVEPNRFHNLDIKKCYEQYDNIVIENIAIKPSSNLQNKMKIYYRDFVGGNFEVASCSLEHVLYHDYVDGDINFFEVPCLTLEELLDKHNIINLDWLLLDIEGIDSEIILDFNWEKYNIKRVEFEHLHLGDKKNIIKEKFLSMGYKQIKSLHEFDWAFTK